jgi:hypothetical protein
MAVFSFTRKRPAAKFRQSQGLDARLGWLVPLSLFGFACWYTLMDYDSPVVAWLSCAVAVSLMLPIAANSYSLVSLVTAVCVYTMFHFSFGPVLNLMLDKPMIRPDLWITTNLAQAACIVGGVTMAVGIWSTRVFFPRLRLPVYGDTVRLVAPPASGMLILLYVPVLAFLMLTGSYDWRFASQADLVEGMGKFGPYMNQLTNVAFLADAGIYLQLFRYVHTRRKVDLQLLIIFACVPVILFAPTGDRGRALAHLPMLVLVYASLEPKRRRSLRSIAVVAAVVVFLTAGVADYRSNRSRRAPDFAGQWEQIITYRAPEGEFTLGDRRLSPLEHVAERLNDYVTCGRILAWTPGIIPFRGAERISDLLYMWVPKILLPDRRNLGQGAALSTKYGVTGRVGASSPSTLPGDLFSRWGWPGIGLGMFFFGAALALGDRFFLRIWSTRLMIFFAMFIRRAMVLSSSDLIGAVIVLGREMLIAALVATVAAAFIDGFFSTTYRFSRDYVLQRVGR